MNIKEIQDLEKEIESIDEIKDWSVKINKMKEIKEKINNQKNKINILLENLSSNNNIKKMKKNKDLSLDELLLEFDKCSNVEDKVKLFNHIQAIIKESELELFDEVVE